MFQFFLAMRYLWVRPLSWVAVLGIWLSVTATITTVAIMSGFIGQLHRTIQGTTGDVILSPRPTFVSREFVTPPANFATFELALAGTEGLDSLAPHLLRPALLRVGTPGKSVKLDERSFVQVIGLDAPRERRTTRFFDYVARVTDAHQRVDDPDRPFWIDQTKLPPEKQDDARLPVALLGIGLFDHFDLKKGDVIRLATMPGTPVASASDSIRPFTTKWIVGGAVRTGHFSHDAQKIYVDLVTARKFAGSAADSSEICIKAEPGVDALALAAKIDGRLQASRLTALVQDWEARHIRDLAPVRNQRSILMVLMLFFVGVACFNIFATLTILVSDKTRDIGLLNAMGASGRGIVRIFTSCGLVIATLGVTAGVASGYLLAGNINRINDLIGHLTGVKIFRGSIYTFDLIPTHIDPLFVVIVIIATILFAITCAFIPAIRAARMDPVRALRYE